MFWHHHFSEAGHEDLTFTAQLRQGLFYVKLHLVDPMVYLAVPLNSLHALSRGEGSGKEALLCRPQYAK